MADVVLETGWACKLIHKYNPNFDRWMTTRNGNTNRPQIKLYSSAKKAEAAARFYPLPEDIVISTFPAKLVIEVPDAQANW